MNLYNILKKKDLHLINAAKNGKNSTAGSNQKDIEKDKNKSSTIFQEDSKHVRQVSGSMVYLFSMADARFELTLLGFDPNFSLCARLSPSKAMIVTANGGTMQWWI